MYDVSDPARRAWWTLFAALAQAAAVPLQLVVHDGPLEVLWARPDLGCAFLCGRPWLLSGRRHVPIAAPVPADPGCAGRPVYRSDFVVRADAPFRSLADTFGHSIGWSVAHSQSGFNAPRHHLMAMGGGARRYRRSIGPLDTPWGCLTALRDGRVDVVPVDSLFLEIGRRTRPDTFAAFRTVAGTAPTPIPLLAGAPDLAPETAARLRAACVALHRGPDLQPAFDCLGILRFDPVDPAAYQVIARQAAEAEAAGVTMPE